jgi:hypothetical protein
MELLPQKLISKIYIIKGNNKLEPMCCDQFKHFDFYYYYHVSSNIACSSVWMNEINFNFFNVNHPEVFMYIYKLHCISQTQQTLLL